MGDDETSGGILAASMVALSFASPATPANTSSDREVTHNLAPGDSFGFLAIAGEDAGPGMWMLQIEVPWREVSSTW